MLRPHVMELRRASAYGDLVDRSRHAPRRRGEARVVKAPMALRPRTEGAL
jgi:hypothetical protein